MKPKWHPKPLKRSTESLVSVGLWSADQGNLLSGGPLAEIGLGNVGLRKAFC